MTQSSPRPMTRAEILSRRSGTNETPGCTTSSRAAASWWRTIFCTGSQILAIQRPSRN